MANRIDLAKHGTASPLDVRYIRIQGICYDVHIDCREDVVKGAFEGALEQASVDKETLCTWYATPRDLLHTACTLHMGRVRDTTVGQRLALSRLVGVSKRSYVSVLVLVAYDIPGRRNTADQVR